MEGPATPSAAYQMISVQEALNIVLNNTSPLPSVKMRFQEARGHVLAEDVLAKEPVPKYRASIKDGYAVVSADGVGEYEVVSHSHAGQSQVDPLRPGAVAYISTGGQVPEGADAVVQIEDTQQAVSGVKGSSIRRVKILKQAKVGQDIRDIGSDVAAGEVVLHAGDVVHAAEIGILATVGATEVQVYRKPRIAVLSTGDEVMEPNVGELPPGKIRDANRAMLLAAASEVLGCSGGVESAGQIIDLGIAGDSKESVEAAIDKAAHEEDGNQDEAAADVLLITGGVSMGDKDYVKPLLEARGTIFFGKVCMKPGKPLTFAKIRRTSSSTSSSKDLLVFGLPGNPASSLVTFHLIVVPCLRMMEGWKDPSLRQIKVCLAAPITMDPVRPEYHRAILHWQTENGENDGGESFIAESTGGQISSRITSLRSANALLEIPAAEGTLPAGTRLTALIIGDLAAMPQHRE